MAGNVPVAADPLPDTDRSTELRSLLGLAFDHSSVAMVLVDGLDEVVCANRAAQELLEVESLAGHLLEEFATTTTVGPAAVAMARGELDHFERETECVTGSGRSLQLGVQVDAIVVPSRRRYFLVQLSDNTEDRRRERELALSEHCHRQVVSNLPDTAVIMFDPDLRITLAAGEALAANGYAADLAGLLLTDAFPQRVLDRLERPYREALDGRDADFGYASPVLGRQFRVRTRAMFDTDGVVVRGLSVLEDISADRARRSQLQKANELGRLGSSRFNRVGGWTFDEELERLWGRRPTPEECGLPIESIRDIDGPQPLTAWDRAISGGGRQRFTYRIRHGVSGESRHFQCAVEAVVDTCGVLMRATATHVDITDAVLAREAAENARATAANERIALLRSVGEALSVGHAGNEELLTGVVKLAALTLGEGAGIRILSTDLKNVERDIIEHPDPAISRGFGESLQASDRSFNPDNPLAAVIARGNIVSRFRTDSWKEEFVQCFRDRVIAQAKDFMIAPVRHDGKVLGLLTVFRTGPDKPYVPGDDDVLQVFADAAGSALAESRLRESVDQGRDLVRELSNHRKDLLHQLAVLETRERSLLAEAIHDEPIQVIVSAVMRLDFLMRRMDPEQAREVESVATALEASVDWLRNLVVVALTPPDLADGLAVSFKVLADGIFSGTPTVFEVERAAEEYLDVPSHDAIYRIFREALVNVRNHAQACRVRLHLSRTAGAVTLSLVDNGVGAADMLAGPGHLGLATMRARAIAEDGVMTIDSSPGLGTTVSVTLPIRESERS